MATEYLWISDGEQALAMGLPFRALASMHSLDRIGLVAGGNETMNRDEADW